MRIDTGLKGWIRGISYWRTTRKTTSNNEIEYNFSRRYLKTRSRKQWSSEFGERLVEQIINDLGCRILNRQPVVQGYNKHKLDLETDNAYIEVKTRNYTTSGTAGEKILYVAAKYSDVFKITGKPVLVVLVGFQEHEAVEKMKFFRDELIPLHQFIWDTYRVKFILCSDLLDGRYNDEL